MKNVLVLLHEDEGQEARLQVALDVARALHGHLMGLDVLVPPAVVTDYAGVADMMVMQYAAEHEAENRTRLVARLEKEDVPFSMLDGIGSPGEELRAAADLADIIVVTSRPGEHDPLDAKHTVSEVVTKSHRPVLAVPPDCKGINLQGKALVAWDGSHAANEALRAALPLLQEASSVTVLELDAEGEFEADDAAEYLSRNGIHAKVVQAQSIERMISEAICTKAKDIDAAYVVMGAYGPGRALEAMFGGVTASMLSKCDLPILLAR